MIMTHKAMFNLFKMKWLRAFDYEVSSWTPYGNGRIKIKFTNQKSIIFYYKNDNCWCIETSKSFDDGIT